MYDEKAYLESKNPVTGEVIWSKELANDAEVNIKIEASKKAYYSWVRSPLSERIDYIKNYQAQLSKQANLLANAICQDTGKPKWETVIEVSAMIKKIDISIQAYNERCPHKKFDSQSIFWELSHKPHGVVLVLGPFNFPCHLPNGHMVPALIAGNSVILKPSELTPYCSEVWMSIIESSGLPKGLVQCIFGGAKIGSFLASHPDIKGVYFTGSHETGLKLEHNTRHHPSKILAQELGGNNPIVISAHVKDIHAAAYLTLQSAFITAGQRCTCARRLIIVKSKVSEIFINILKRLIKSIQIGKPYQEPDVFMGPLISEAAARNVIAYQSQLIKNGGIAWLKAAYIPGLSKSFLSPGLIYIKDLKLQIDEEVFGPLLQVQFADSFEEALAYANKTEYGLSASIFSDREADYREAFYTLNAGLINWNMPTTGAHSALPFGGVGKSGNYRPSAYYASDYCAYPVASTQQKRCQKPGVLLPGLTYEIS